jgi:hypothetical protein
MRKLFIELTNMTSTKGFLTHQQEHWYVTEKGWYEYGKRVNNCSDTGHGVFKSKQECIDYLKTMKIAYRDCEIIFVQNDSYNQLKDHFRDEKLNQLGI